MGVVLENGTIESDDEKPKIPAGVDLRVPADVMLIGDVVRDLLRCGYDVSVEQVYSDSFAVPRLDHYVVTISGNLNFEEAQA